jgi:hypothetical protein
MRVIPATDAAIELAVLHSEMSPHLPLPFKPIFFAPVDGWSLVAGGLVQGHGGSQAISPGRLDDGPLFGAKPTSPKEAYGGPRFDRAASTKTARSIPIESLFA